MNNNAPIKKHIAIVILSLLTIALFSGCKPDKIELEIYTSDIQKAKIEGIVEVPFSATFSIMGEDDEGILPQAAAIAKGYLGEKAEFKISKGDWGDQMIVKGSVPMGTTEALNAYLSTNSAPFVLRIKQFGKNDPYVSFETTTALNRLDQELSNVNMMLGAEMPAKSTIIRFIGDQSEAPRIGAVAVFIDNKPELLFGKEVARRTSLALEYKGEAASVYSEISPSFSYRTADQITETPDSK